MEPESNQLSNTKNEGVSFMLEYQQKMINNSRKEIVDEQIKNNRENALNNIAIKKMGKVIMDNLDIDEILQLHNAIIQRHGAFEEGEMKEEDEEAEYQANMEASIQPHFQ